MIERDTTATEEPPLSDAELAAAEKGDREWEQEVERHARRTPEGQPAVEIRDLGIRYNLRLTRRNTLKQSLVKMIRRSEEVKQTHFWAIRHLDLDIEHGDNLGVLGPNGAGKTTLLRALAGVLAPSEGTVEMFGGTSTLLTIGAGFDGDLTGRDNIDLAGAFLGIPHQEMARLTPDIIEFADIGPFIDAPLRTYSTGMKARLGFSIATSVIPDILLLDEVLGTGDQTFRAKSQARIRELIQTAKAVVVVTHDLGYVTEFCNRAMLMERGGIVAQGDPAEIVGIYRDRVRERKLVAENEAKRFAAGVPG
jgi:ABC-type polysaccharide/polyol phosphate transport system ATPase subunit